MLASPGLAVRTAASRPGARRGWVVPLRRGELRLEGQGVAAADLEALERAARAGAQGRGQRCRSMDCRSQEVGLRVKLGAVSSHATERMSSGMPSRMRRAGVGDGADLGGFGVDVEGGPDHHRAEVEGAGDRRGDRPPGRAGRPCRGRPGRRGPGCRRGWGRRRRRR